ncbi:hypothetical protein F2P79_022460 [Pimephales promelas]|nr:hypothetical protein F2P79_022460 [Pimephales promelas]
MCAGQRSHRVVCAVGLGVRSGKHRLVDFLSLPSFLLCEGTHLKNENKAIVPVLFLKSLQMLLERLEAQCEERRAGDRRVMDSFHAQHPKSA